MESAILDSVSAPTTTVTRVFASAITFASVARSLDFFPDSALERRTHPVNPKLSHNACTPESRVIGCTKLSRHKRGARRKAVGLSCMVRWRAEFGGISILNARTIVSTDRLYAATNCYPE